MIGSAAEESLEQLVLNFVLVAVGLLIVATSFLFGLGSGADLDAARKAGRAEGAAAAARQGYLEGKEIGWRRGVRLGVQTASATTPGQVKR